MMHFDTRQAVRPRVAGFTLVEILISLGLFAIGMIAVASLFPVAALLQRQTAAEVIGEHAAQNAKAIVEAKSLSYTAPTSGLIGTGDLGPYHSLAGTTGTEAVPLSAIRATLLTKKFTYSDRSYPSATPSVADRDLFWVPFVQNISGDPDNPNWVMRLFLLEPDGRVTYPTGVGANPNDPAFIPKVVSVGCSVSNQNTFALTSATHGLQGGDKIMDNNGTDYTIASVNGSSVTVLGRILLSPSAPKVIWYAPPYTGTQSPTQRIITVKLDKAVKK